MNKKRLQELLKEVTVTNVGEVKENDLLVFQFDYNKIDAGILGAYMKMIKEEGIRAVVFPQSDKIVEKHDAEVALKILEIAKKSLEEIIYNKE